MYVNIFILCYNESVLIKHTINHYKKNIPNCKITIYDNESTDDSVEIAKSMGCDVISWNSNNIIDDFKYIYIKNNCWKNVESGWIIMIDMDEWLCVTENDLKEEYENGVSILKVKGYDIIGESKKIDLSDIELNEISRCIYNKKENKSLCFLKDKVININYNYGAHNCNPKGIIKYSKKTYNNKHMAYLGLIYITDKMIKRYNRSELMRNNKLATHYTNNINEIINKYYKKYNKSNKLLF